MAQNIKNIEEQTTVDLPKIVGMLLISLPMLLVRFTRVFLGFKRDANKGGRIFNYELRKQGLDDEIARKLTEMYLETANVRRIVQMFWNAQTTQR